jgi:hypothetical protein
MATQIDWDAYQVQGTAPHSPPDAVDHPFTYGQGYSSSRKLWCRRSSMRHSMATTMRILQGPPSTKSSRYELAAASASIEAEFLAGTSPRACPCRTLYPGCTSRRRPERELLHPSLPPSRSRRAMLHAGGRSITCLCDMCSPLHAAFYMQSASHAPGGGSPGHSRHLRSALPHQRCSHHRPKEARPGCAADRQAACSTRRRCCL